MALLCLLGSCSSPIDEDTPRRRTVDGRDTLEPSKPPVNPPPPARKVFPKSIISSDIAISGNTTTTWAFSLDRLALNPILLDTTVSPVRIWLDLHYLGSGPQWNKIELTEVWIHVDSAAVPATDIPLLSSPDAGNGARVTGIDRNVSPQRKIVQETSATKAAGNIAIQRDTVARRILISILIPNIDIPVVGIQTAAGDILLEY